MSCVWPTSPAQAPRKARGCVTMPAVDKGERVDKLGAEPLRAPTVPGQSCKGAVGGKRADVAAKARLLAPDRHKHRRRHAEALLDLGERRGIALELGLASRDHSRRDVSCGEAGEVVPEHGGAAVVPLDRRVIGNAVERRIHGPARQTVHHRDFLEGGEPGAEALAVLAAILRMSRRGGEECRHRDECQSSQCLPQITAAIAKARDANRASHIPGICMISVTSIQAPGIWRCG